MGNAGMCATENGRDFYPQRKIDSINMDPPISGSPESDGPKETYGTETSYRTHLEYVHTIQQKDAQIRNYQDTCTRLTQELEVLRQHKSLEIALVETTSIEPEISYKTQFEDLKAEVARLEDEVPRIGELETELGALQQTCENQKQQIHTYYGQKKFFIGQVQYHQQEVNVIRQTLLSSRRETMVDLSSFVQDFENIAHEIRMKCSNVKAQMDWMSDVVKASDGNEEDTQMINRIVTKLRVEETLRDIGDDSTSESSDDERSNKSPRYQDLRQASTGSARQRSLVTQASARDWTEAELESEQQRMTEELTNLIRAGSDGSEGLLTTPGFEDMSTHTQHVLHTMPPVQRERELLRPQSVMHWNNRQLEEQIEDMTMQLQTLQTSMHGSVDPDMMSSVLDVNIFSDDSTSPEPSPDPEFTSDLLEQQDSLAEGRQSRSRPERIVELPEQRPSIGGRSPLGNRSADKNAFRPDSAANWSPQQVARMTEEMRESLNSMQMEEAFAAQFAGAENSTSESDDENR